MRYSIHVETRRYRLSSKIFFVTKASFFNLILQTILVLKITMFCENNVLVFWMDGYFAYFLLILSPHKYHKCMSVCYETIHICMRLSLPFH